MQHTPISYAKDNERCEWLYKILPTKEILTISHGLLGVLNVLRWKGAIQVVDTDIGVIKATEYVIPDFRKLKSRLHILPPIHRPIQDMIRPYLIRRGAKNLGAVDIDLACNVVEATHIALPVLQALTEAKYKGKTLVTFRNGRDDGFSDLDGRIDYLRQSCSDVGAKIVSVRPYVSQGLESNAKRKKGSAMCIVDIRWKQSSKA
jgi:hypothetical protein